MMFRSNKYYFLFLQKICGFLSSRACREIQAVDHQSWISRQARDDKLHLYPSFVIPGVLRLRRRTTRFCHPRSVATRDLLRYTMFSGFSLLEIMIAMAILASGLLTLYLAHSNAVISSTTSERIQLASMLAKQKLTDYMLDLEKDMALGVFPEEKEEEGVFEPPFEDYKWEIKIKQVKIPISGGSINAGGDNAEDTSTGLEDKPAQAPKQSQSLDINTKMAQFASEKISKALREIKIKITWEGGGEEAVNVTTHLANLKLP